jgi:glutamate 5-kinase
MNNKIKRVVIKIGSSSISSLEGGMNRVNLNNIVNEINYLHKKNIEAVLVSSGAVSLGLHLRGLKKRPSRLSELQSMASVGQIELIKSYQKNLSKKGISAGQILLTNDDLENRKRYLNAKDTLNELLKRKIVPIINENDSVSFDEIKFGDNDFLASAVSNLLQADLLVLFTDQEGIYEDDPRINKKALLIKEINVADALLQQIKNNITNKTEIGSGGIRSKILAAEFAAKQGTTTVVAKGVRKNFFSNLIDNNKSIGTRIISNHVKLNAKKNWVSQHLKSKGEVFIDSGAVKALTIDNKSLLPVGVKKINGNFKRGDLIICRSLDGKEVARGLSNYSSEDAMMIIGLSNTEIKKILKYDLNESLIHRDNLVIT